MNPSSAIRNRVQTRFQKPVRFLGTLHLAVALQPVATEFRVLGASLNPCRIRLAVHLVALE